MSEELADLWRHHMRRGDFEAAWRISDEVLKMRGAGACAHTVQESTWRGESLHGKRVLVRCCYGLGDTIQFVRYVPLLRRIARSVIVDTQPALAKVLQRVVGIDRVTATSKISPKTYDIAIGLTELPHVFTTAVQTITAQIPYIQIAARSLAATTNIKVGLVWQGSDWDPRRAVPLQLFGGLEVIPGLTLHIVQRGRALRERPIGFGIDSGSDDLYEAARTIAALDLLITIDSMPAHLAGGMGVPTWVLLHSDCDWRWMQNRSTSPWYPTMRLFRQKNPGDWRSVIARLKEQLERLARSRVQRLSAAA